jgi:hypothetical protein
MHVLFEILIKRIENWKIIILFVLTAMHILKFYKCLRKFY